MSTISRPSTRRFRLPLMVLGGLAFALGVLTIVAPAVADAIPIEAVVALLGNDYILVAALAGAAVLVVLTVLVARGVTGINQTTPPDPEEVHSVPRFGEAFDEVISRGGLRALLTTERHRQVRTRLREAAIATVMRETNCTRAEARERVERGTWTDDPEAAAFLAEAKEGNLESGSGPGPGPGPATGPGSATGVAARVRAAIGGETPFQRGARRTAAEIVRRDPEVAE